MLLINDSENCGQWATEPFIGHDSNYTKTINLVTLVKSMALQTMDKDLTATKVLRQPSVGENTDVAKLKRGQFLQSLGKDIIHISDTYLTSNEVKSNIEAFTGAVSIPVGLVGPLNFEFKPNEYEQVFTLAATTEGALVASMNRGASVINSGGGFRAYVQDKLMLRAPVFCFENVFEAEIFTKWLDSQTQAIAEYVKQYSKRAELVEIKKNVWGKIVDTKFYYRTQDASGQNMTTTCTWHACLWIENEFNKVHKFKIKNFVLEGNGGSDKKFTYSAMINGRGVNVVAEAIVDRKVLVERLKVTPEEVLHFFNNSRQIAIGDGMCGNNVNVANSIAAIFTATGQDIACIQESAVGILHVEPHERGLYFSLKLPKLVIGSVGGGTGLRSQKEALEVMGCYGTGKVERLAKLIAGFTLGLEISTMGAMISGQFAIAHERLGRNKPTNFVKLEEIKAGYLQNAIKEHRINFAGDFEEKNGIITQITNKNSSKHLGLSLWQVENKQEKALALLKSKPTSQETLNCMYVMTGLIDPKLAKEFCIYQNKSEFINNHVREISIYNYLSKANFNSIPKYYGGIVDHERESYMFLMEYLDQSQFKILNSENTPEAWTQDDFKLVIDKVLEASSILEQIKDPSLVNLIRFSDYGSFTHKCIETLNVEYGKSYSDILKIMKNAHEYLASVESTVLSDQSFVIVHNDFNPRNIGITKDNQVKIYDWELSTLDCPQRDFMELYCFTKNKNSNFGDLKDHFERKFKENFKGSKLVTNDNIYKYAFAKFLVTRVSLYLLGHKLTHYSFLKNLIKNIVEINQEEKYFV